MLVQYVMCMYVLALQCDGVWCVCVCVCVCVCLCVCVCARTCMCPHVHTLCAQDVSKQLEGLANHLRASGKKPDSPHTQLALIGSSQAVLLVSKLSLPLAVNSSESLCDAVCHVSTLASSGKIVLQVCAKEAYVPTYVDTQYLRAIGDKGSLGSMFRVAETPQ